MLNGQSVPTRTGLLGYAIHHVDISNNSCIPLSLCHDLVQIASKRTVLSFGMTFALSKKRKKKKGHKSWHVLQNGKRVAYRAIDFDLNLSIDD